MDDVYEKFEETYVTLHRMLVDSKEFRAAWISEKWHTSPKSSYHPQLSVFRSGNCKNKTLIAYLEPTFKQKIQIQISSPVWLIRVVNSSMIPHTNVCRACVIANVTSVKFLDRNSISYTGHARHILWRVLSSQTGSISAQPGLFGLGCDLCTWEGTAAKSRYLVPTVLVLILDLHFYKAARARLNK